MKHLTINKVIPLFIVLLLNAVVKAYGFTVDGLNYSINSGSSTVTVTGGTINTGALIIPETVTYNGTTYTVKAIGKQAFNGRSGLTSVTIPKTITSFDAEAFEGCTGLTAVHISDLAAWCRITFTTSWTKTESYWTEEWDVDYGGYIMRYYTKYKLKVSNPLMYAHNLFLNGQKVEKLIIPNSTSINRYAFYGCSSLTELTIDNSVTTIGYGAFNGCTNLTKVHITDIANWSSHSFNDERATTSSYDMPDDCEDPDDCQDTEYVHVYINDLPNTNPLEYAHNLYYNGEKIENLVIPNSVKSIGMSAFKGCSGLTSVTIPNSVTAIGNNAFSGCSGLTSVNIPNSITSIGGYGFGDCNNLTGFYTSIEKPSKVSLGANVFYNVPTTTCVLHVPTGTVSLYRAAAQWKAFSHIVEPEPETISATSVALDRESAGLSVGETLTLAASVLPTNATNKTVSWKSSNDNIATVNQNGMVTAKAVGTATITATTTDGSNLSASCVVTVTGITGITFNKTATIILVGNSETLSATVTPSDVINKTLNWTSSNTTIATVDQNGKVTAIAPGTATITASATDGSGVSASCVVTVLNGFELTAPLVLNLRGEEATYELAVELRNEVPVTALQFVMTVPDGFALATDSYGDYDVWLDDARKTRSHTVSVVPYGNSGKAYQVIISSPTNRDLNGNDGALVHFSLKGEKYPQTIGYSKMAYTHIVAADANETQYNLPDAESDLVNGYIVGDANADARVDVGDYVVTANYMLNRTGETPFYPDAANAAQGDADINVTDLVAITNIGLEIRGREIVPALPSSAASPRRLPVALAGDDIACELSVDDISGDLTTVSLAIDNDASLAALQCDIELPSHITVANAAVTSRSARHSVAFNRLETGATRLLLSSFGTNDIAAGEGAVVTLTLRGQVQAGDLLTVGNLLMAERDLTTHGGADLTIDLGELSDIKGVATDRIAIYGRDGHIVIDSPAAGTAQLIWPNGISQELKVVAGRNTYPVATGGICIVRFGHEVKKLKF